MGEPIVSLGQDGSSGYRWWIERFRTVLSLVDRVRLDHFRGFEAYWEIPAAELTAIRGRWVPGPGASLFEKLQASLGELPIVAENLGVITPEVEAIRERFGYPGMSILQFAFGRDPQGPSFQPHNYSRNLVAYTGTHDNDTTVGWFTSRDTDDSTRTYERSTRKDVLLATIWEPTGGRSTGFLSERCSLPSRIQSSFLSKTCWDWEVRHD